MSADVQWTGLAEFRALMRELPVALRDRARDIVDNAAHTTASQLRQAYPLGETGKLREGVEVKETVQPVGIVDVVLSKTYYAAWWEYGTKSRKTKLGWDRGKIRPAHDLGHEGLIAISVRNRRAMYRALVQMLTDEGFETSGIVSGLE